MGEMYNTGNIDDYYAAKLNTLQGPNGYLAGYTGMQTKQNQDELMRQQYALARSSPTGIGQGAALSAAMTNAAEGQAKIGNAARATALQEQNIYALGLERQRLQKMKEEQYRNWLAQQQRDYRDKWIDRGLAMGGAVAGGMAGGPAGASAGSSIASGARG
jgi:hypothetical protein